MTSLKWIGTLRSMDRTSCPEAGEKARTGKDEAEVTIVRLTLIEKARTSPPVNSKIDCEHSQAVKLRCKEHSTGLGEEEDF